MTTQENNEVMFKICKCDSESFALVNKMTTMTNHTGNMLIINNLYQWFPTFYIQGQRF